MSVGDGCASGVHRSITGVATLKDEPMGYAFQRSSSRSSRFASSPSFSSTSFIPPLPPGVRVPRKPREPIAHELESTTIEMVSARTPLPLVIQQASRLEPLDVPRRGRPGMIEHAGDLTRRHRSALEVHCDQDPSAHWMGKRREHGLVRVECRLRRLPRRTLRHIDGFSLQTKYCQGYLVCGLNSRMEAQVTTRGFLDVCRVRCYSSPHSEVS